MQQTVAAFCNILHTRSHVRLNILISHFTLSSYRKYVSFTSVVDCQKYMNTINLRRNTLKRGTFKVFCNFRLKNILRITVNNFFQLILTTSRLLVPNETSRYLLYTKRKYFTKNAIREILSLKISRDV